MNFSVDNKIQLLLASLFYRITSWYSVFITILFMLSTRSIRLYREKGRQDKQLTEQLIDVIHLLMYDVQPMA